MTTTGENTVPIAMQTTFEIEGDAVSLHQLVEDDAGNRYVCVGHKNEHVLLLEPEHFSTSNAFAPLRVGAYEWDDRGYRPMTTESGEPVWGY